MSLKGWILTFVAAICLVFSVSSCGYAGVLSSDKVAAGNHSHETDKAGSESAPAIMVNITMTGGSGKAYVTSPVAVIQKDGMLYATLVWSSRNYDYVIVDKVRYDNENPGGNSTFTVPVKSLDEPFTFIADTTAMSTPHEIEYTIEWNTDTASSDKSSEEEVAVQFGARPSDLEDIRINGLEKSGSVPLSYAKGFEIDSYGDYSLIRIYGADDFLLVPEGAKVPEDIPENVKILQQPLDRTYLVSSSVMDLVRQISALDMIRMSGTKEDEWDIPEVRECMHSGQILYAGKYRAPDFELIVSQGCDLAIENTMIYHNPEIREKLEELGIPVIVETSSYESDPLGRLEWIKLYGTLFGRETEALDYFDREAKRFETLSGGTGLGSVAFFSVSATGLVNVRKSGDYVTKLIELAGGTYVPDTTGTGSQASSMNMQMEDFYASAKDADVIIYNSTIEDELGSISDLTDKSPLFRDFKAVRDGRVYCLRKEFFQNTTKMADLLQDLNTVLENKTGDMRFLRRL